MVAHDQAIEAALEWAEQTAVEQTRYDLAHELLDDIGHLDAQLGHRSGDLAVDSAHRLRR